MTKSIAERRRDIIVAGHRGQRDRVLAALDDEMPEIRVVAVGAAARCEALTAHLLSRALDDPAVAVRLRAIEVVARVPGTEPPTLTPTLDDENAMVVERAAWASGERQPPEPGIIGRLASLATGHEHKLVRESAVAALGAIGDPAGLEAILSATTDVATIRRRAVLALAPFDGPEVTDALETALRDRDWQTRQAAADVLGVDDIVP
ncbi:MAG TPA: HEAT repeat domain-containing protein [Acidimicrobiales bacterium]|nr:HEAT repeat domain-containing protein [Acidimicrobiales bacterium]